MGPLVTREHRDKVASYLESGPAQGATLVADGRETAPENGGFFLGVSLLDDITPEMDAYRDEIFGPVLSVVRVKTYDEAPDARQRQPVRQRRGDLHPRRRRRPAVPVRRERRHGRDQRPIPVPVAVLLVRGLEELAVRGPAHLRPRGDRLLHAHEGGHEPLAGPRRRAGSTSASRKRGSAHLRLIAEDEAEGLLREEYDAASSGPGRCSTS
jgi:hypothetical protein